MFENYQAKRPCPICNSKDIRWLFNIKFSKDEFLPEQYDIVACRRCSFVYNDFLCPPENFHKYYGAAGKYGNAQLLGGGGVSEKELNAWKYTTDILLKYLPDKNVKIIDIGCGKGGYLKYLKSIGFSDLLGVDPCQEAICSLQAEGISGYTGDFHSIKGKYDLIIFTSVLEHLVAPLDFFEEVKKHLVPGGILLIVVPDAAKYKEFTNSPFYYFDREHINHFTSKTLALAGILNSLDCLEVEETDQLTVADLKHYDLIGVFRNPSSELTDAVTDYIDQCVQKNKKLIVSPSVYSDETIFLWGIGAFAASLLESNFFAAFSDLHLIDIDHSKQGKKINQYLIESPEALFDNKSAKKTVVITSVLYENQIRQQLHDLGFSGKIATIVPAK